MLFNSYAFIFVFLPICAVGFYAFKATAPYRVALGWLTLCSLAFYAYWNPANLPLLLGSLSANFALSKFLQAERWSRGWRKAALTLGVVANVGALGYYKYANFFLDTLNASFGTEVSLLTLALPLAISFCTFLQVAYLVDAFRGLTRGYDFLDYCLFVTFFPHLIAGPIVHHNELLPEFAGRRHTPLLSQDISVGLTIFVFGLFKKVMLADNVAPFANQMFDATHAGLVPGFWAAWVGALAYTMQLYFDFSGYSDMAIGLGHVFGVRLPMNFNSPYKATSATDFWHRWHMTLSRYLRQYVYIPLGGNRRGTARRYFNLMATMVLGGMWHGAGWTFLMWGALHGGYLCVHRAWDAFANRCGWTGRHASAAWRAASISITFVAIVVGWVLFRAARWQDATTILGSMAGFNGWLVATDVVRKTAIAWSLGLLAVAWFAPNAGQIMAHFEPAYDWQRLSTNLPAVPRWLRWQPRHGLAIVAGIAAGAAVLAMSTVSEFLYFQF